MTSTTSLFYFCDEYSFIKCLQCLHHISQDILVENCQNLGKGQYVLLFDQRWLSLNLRYFANITRACYMCMHVEQNKWRSCQDILFMLQSELSTDSYLLSCNILISNFKICNKPILLGICDVYFNSLNAIAGQNGNLIQSGKARKRWASCVTLFID